MPKKRSRRKPSSGGVRTLRAVRAPSTELARLRGPFLAWLAEHDLPPQVDPGELWDDLDAVVSVAARTGLADLHAWTADQIDALADAVDDEDFTILSALPPLLAFLVDTGRWSGTPEQFEEAMQAAEDAASPLTALLDELAEVSVDPAAEDAALRALPVVAQAEALLRFLAPRRPVTSTGALRRADLAPAAALVGVDLEERAPRSMWEVERLADLWQVVEATELLTVSATQAVPTPLALDWLAGDTEAGAQARALVVEGYVAHLLTAATEAPWLPPPMVRLLPGLVAAALGRPFPTAQVTEGPSTGPLPGLAAAQARELLDRLAGERILRVADTVTVTPGLERALARVTAILLLADAEAHAEPDLPPPDPGLAGQAWRLRVELAHAEPPVWREVLVDPDLPLDELHEVIQRVFAWEDYHLHDFTAVDPRGRAERFAPPDPEDDDWSLPGAPPTTDERTVRLSQLIAPRHGRLQYRYDFGDDWDHRITVVGAQPAADTPLPRCTGGSGAAPHEDSGGVWGWAEMVATARDPRHPEHAEVREWLDLADGETLDPAAFDAAEVDERLAELRSG